MRQYRGKDIETGEWRYGYLSYSEQQDRYYIGTTELLHPVDPDTVGQFWQNDKNGVGIYKGDFIKDSEETYVLEYGEFEDRDVDDLMYGWYMIHIPRGETFVAYSDTSQLEVIGSIHDNPELL